MNDNDFISKLASLNITPQKIDEIRKNPKISHTLSILLSTYDPPHKLFYSLSSKIPKNYNTFLSDSSILFIGELITKNVICHDKQIDGCLDYIKSNNKICLESEENSFDKIELEKYISQFNKSENEIRTILESRIEKSMNRKEVGKFVNGMSDMKYCNSSVINKVIDEIILNNQSKTEKTPSEASKIEKNRNVNVKNKKMSDKIVKIVKNSVEEDKFSWLREGEISFINKPDTNPLNKKEILDKHLKRTGGRVITRFPPEPNGYLHIGHAKAMNLSYDFCKMNNGSFILRYDDTNPKNEQNEFYNTIKEDVLWLLSPEKDVNYDKKDLTSNSKNDNIVFSKITCASDYFDKFIKFGFELIEKDKAFVCNQTQEEMKKSREKNEESPFRTRSKEINKLLFQEMIDGKWNEGTISLRLKQDMKSTNPLMHDLVAFRVIDSFANPHCKTGIKYRIYPAYDFTHCINDSLEDITHSFCSREFYNRRETYYWVLDALDLYKPVQWEFSRLCISDVMLSKRKITDLVNKKIVSGWDDPRLYTICGLRRRGFTSDGINKFVKSLGITFNTSIIDVKLLESFVREDLDKKALRINCVIDPLLVKVYNEKNEFERDIYIENSDFDEKCSEGFLRLTPNQSVGLLNLYNIKFLKKETNLDCICVVKTSEKPKKFIHWVDAVENSKIELRMYDSMYKNGEFNEKSLEIKIGYCEKDISSAKIYDKFQFRRVGFFCVDKDSTEKNIVVNLTLPLKNSTWK